MTNLKTWKAEIERLAGLRLDRNPGWQRGIELHYQNNACAVSISVSRQKM